MTRKSPRRGTRVTGIVVGHANPDFDAYAAMVAATKLFEDTLGRHGVKAFSAVGQPFDPELMEAITHMPADEKNASGTVIDEVEKGYKLGF